MNVGTNPSKFYKEILKAIKGPPKARRLTTNSESSNKINEALDADPG